MTTAETEKFRVDAVELEQEADRYPEERAEILQEAAGMWKHAGDTDRAEALLRQVLDLGGDESGFARFELVELCLERGAEDDAWAHLAALEKTESAGSGPAELVAELLDERGDHDAALRWFDRAVDRAAVDRMLADSKFADVGTMMTLFGRQRCRRNRGLPPDELDRAADAAEDFRQELVANLDRLGSDEAVPGRSPAPATDMLVWPRDEIARAAEKWPDVFAADLTAYCGDVERQLRRLADQQHRKTITLLVGTAEGFEQHLRGTGGDAADESARQSYATHLRELGRTTSWPPERNQLCWCGSARKYKKCCGGPGSV